MTHTYVRIEADFPTVGLTTVVEVIGPIYDGMGNYIPIEQRYHPDFVALLIEVTDLNPQPGEWWTYDGENFHPPGE